MLKINDIMDRDELRKLIEERYISCVVSPDARLVLYNYTEKATYDRIWTPETRACRGLVTEATTDRIIARPFEKFSNIDESGFPESALDALLARPGPVEITDKLDGSMIVMWHYANEWHCSTRGSFTSTQALAARRWLDAFDLRNWPTDYTFIAEWCAPDNRVVLKYEQPELRLIGVREYDGHDARYAELCAWGEVLGLPVVPVVTDCDLETLVTRRVFTTGVEGWVARWPDGYRVKIKTEDYLRLHRLISGFSPSRVRDLMLTGGAQRYAQELPEEIRVEAEAIIATLERLCSERREGLTRAYAQLSPLLSESRKAYALAVQQEPKEDWSFLFSLADNKPIEEKLLKAIDLVALYGEVEAPDA